MLELIGVPNSVVAQVAEELASYVIEITAKFNFTHSVPGARYYPLKDFALFTLEILELGN